jgi:gliding motility-associated-like protein
MFTITAPNNFTSMNISGPGGQNGSLISLCANSIININCNSGTDAPLLSTTTLQSLCNIDTVNLNSISSSNTPPTVGVSLMWFTGAPPIAANMLTIVQANAQPAGPNYYAAFFDSINNCYSNATAVNTLINQPIMPIFNEVNPICSGTAINPLPLTSDNNIVGSWTPSINNEQTTTYTFNPNTGECATSTSLTIEVIQTPSVTITSNCIGLSFELTAVVTSSDNVSFNWYNSQNELIGNTPSIIITTTGNYKVIVTNLYCSGIATSTIGNIFCEIQKGISPNNDGDNDFFDLQLFEVKNLGIYSRYGMKIYSQNNYKNQWVGQSDKGDELPDGTYYYVIERINGEIKTGWIYLNRQY